jgi:transposase InsO family protein
MKYDFIESHRSAFAVERMCRALGVRRSGYYAWRGRVPGRRSAEDEHLLVRIRESYKMSRRSYGSPRVLKDLRAWGLCCGKNRVARLMREHGIAACAKKKFKATTNSRHALPVAPNLLNREFNVARPDEAWVGDITYVWTREGWLYLAVVLDLFSRKVIGWGMGDRLTAEIALSALKMAIVNRRPSAGLIYHSDRGVQYACEAFRKLLELHGFIQSMSRKGDCWDNAVAESFFHSLKTEHVYFEDYKTRAEAKDKIFEYIEVFYNRTRRHSTLEYLSPAEFEAIMVPQA